MANTLGLDDDLDPVEVVQVVENAFNVKFAKVLVDVLSDFTGVSAEAIHRDTYFLTSTLKKARAA